MFLEEVFGKWKSEEFDKLVKELDAAHIKYEIRDRLGGKQICIPDIATLEEDLDRRRISVISSNLTYGGEQGLMEIYAKGLNDGVEGYLNAEQAFEYIMDTLKGISRNSCG